MAFWSRTFALEKSVSDYIYPAQHALPGLIFKITLRCKNKSITFPLIPRSALIFPIAIIDPVDNSVERGMNGIWVQSNTLKYCNRELATCHLLCFLKTIPPRTLSQNNFCVWTVVNLNRILSITQFERFVPDTFAEMSFLKADHWSDLWQPLNVILSLKALTI